MSFMVMKLMLGLVALIQPVCGATFDVASIRPAAPGAMTPADLLRDGPQLSPVTFTMRNTTLKACIRWAWSVTEAQVNGPGWMATERFDIVGKSASPASEPEFRQMLQTLLKERFRLEFHRQTKEQSVYVLSVAKNGPNLKESAAEGEPSAAPNMARMSMAVKHAKVSALAELLSKVLFLPVIDQTGLTGFYDVSINVGKYLPQSGDGIPDIVGILTTGLREELGLKLEPKKLPLDLLIVDSADRVPSEN